MIWRIKPGEPDKAVAETKHGTFVIEMVRGHGTQRFRLRAERKYPGPCGFADTLPVNKSFSGLESAKCAAQSFNWQWEEGS